MPATITGAVKAILAGPLPTVPVFRDEEPVGGVPSGGKWIVVHEGLSQTPTDAETKGVRRRRELHQIDLWQNTKTAVDDETIAPTIVRSLDAAAPFALTGGDGVVRLRPEGYRRQFDPATRLLQESITVAATRHLT